MEAREDLSIDASEGKQVWSCCNVISILHGRSCLILVLPSEISPTAGESAVHSHAVETGGSEDADTETERTTTEASDPEVSPKVRPEKALRDPEMSSAYLSISTSKRFQFSEWESA